MLFTFPAGGTTLAHKKDVNCAIDCWITGCEYCFFIMICFLEWMMIDYCISAPIALKALLLLMITKRPFTIALRTELCALISFKLVGS